VVTGQARKAPCHHHYDEGGQREHERNHPADMFGRLLRIQVHRHRGRHPGDGDGDRIPGAGTLEQDGGRIDRSAMGHAVRLVM
jgi:hypothetical protein